MGHPTTGASSEHLSLCLLELCPDFPEIKGWLSLTGAEFLFQSARAVTDGVVVEVGSAYGRSTTALALGAMAGANMPVFAVDPHEAFDGVRGGRFGPNTRRQFYRTMLRHGGWRNVRLLNVSSEVVAPSFPHRVGLLWIDGDHTYDAVRRDIDAWTPHLLPGASVVFDDVAGRKDDGPTRVHLEMIESGRFALQEYVDKKIAVLRFEG